MKLLKILNAANGIVAHIKREFEWNKITEKDLDELKQFMKSKEAKQMEDYPVFEKMHLFGRLFFVTEKDENMKKPVRKAGRPKKDKK